MSNHRSPITPEEWDLGLPDFAEQNAAFLREARFAAILIVGLVAGAYILIHF